jgi:hypothetical protein
MKQLLSLFLFLAPCLALAQYPSNGNQKITLGEQSTADGLIYRGLAADTTRKPSVDTMAYIILDTATNIQWHYKKATSNAWLRVGGSITSGLTGTLPVANGGTGSTTQNFVDLTTTQSSIGGAKTFTSTVTGARFDPTNSTVTGTGMYLPSSGKLGFSISGTQKMNLQSNGVGYGTDLFSWISGISFVLDFPQLAIASGASGGGLILSNLYINTSNQPIYKTTQGATWINTQAGSISFRTAPSGSSGSVVPFNDDVLVLASDGNVGIGTASPAVQFHTTSNVRFAGLTSITDLRTDADGDLFNGSDFNLKNSIDTINFGLQDVLKLKPVQFNWNDISRNLNEYKNLGFIAQDVMDVIPNAASSMGDGDMQVDYNAIVATLTKAIQEQQALIKTLEQRIINLENK